MALTKAKGHILADDLALGGNPTTSTQSTGNNTTRLATTAFVQTELSALVDSSPSALNTLNELAAALGDDASFSTTVTNSIATKVPLAGGTMTGTLNFGDGVRARFGTGNDLNIFHDGSNAFLLNVTSGGGALTLKSHDINIMDAQSHNMAVFTQDGAVTLYHDNAAKLATASGGVAVTGTINLSGAITSTVASGGGVYHAITHSGNEAWSWAAQSGAGSDDYLDVGINGGTRVMSWHEDGKVGIGTTAPSTLLHLSAGATGSAGGGYAGISMTNKYNSPDNSWVIQPQRTGSSNDGLEIRDVTDSRSVMSFDGGGFVGIGTDTPDHPLEVVGVISSADSGVQKGTFANVGNDLVLTANAGQTNVSSEIIFKSSQSGGSATERMRIASNGYLVAQSASQVRLVLGSTGNSSNNTSNWIRGTGNELGLNSGGGNIGFEINGSAKATINATGQILLNSLGVSTPTFAFINDTNTGMTRPTGDTLQFVTGGTERMRIKADGQITTSGDILPGADVIMANGRGISFAASSNASGMSSELLDDYEEGAWTPVLANQGYVAQLSGSHSQIGKYTRVGNLVHAQCWLHGVTPSGSATDVYIRGLPFTSINYGAGAVWNYSGFTGMSSSQVMMCRTEINSTNLLLQLVDGGTGASMSSSYYGGAINLMVSLTYVTS
jgi:hypothetical protein